MFSKKISQKVWFNMLIKNDRYKLLYHIIPKAACTSIRSVLLGEEHKHKTRNFDVRLSYLNYLRFTFVRHPLSRLISCYGNIMQENTEFSYRLLGFLHLQKVPNIDEFFETVSKIDDSRINWHFRSQTKLIKHNKMDFIGRFENLLEDWSKLNLPPLPHENKTQHAYWKKYYYDEDGRIKPIARILEKRYEDDLKVFNYKTLEGEYPNG